MKLLICLFQTLLVLPHYHLMAIKQKYSYNCLNFDSGLGTFLDISDETNYTFAGCALSVSVPG